MNGFLRLQMTHWWDNSFSAGGSGTKSADPPGLWWPVSCTEVRCWNRNPDRWQDDLHSYIVYSYNILIWIIFYKYSIIPISILSSFFHHHFSMMVWLRLWTAKIPVMPDLVSTWDAFNREVQRKNESTGSDIWTWLQRRIDLFWLRHGRAVHRIHQNWTYDFFSTND